MESDVAQASRLPWPHWQPGWLSELRGISCPPSGWGQPTASETGETPVLLGPADVALSFNCIVPVQSLTQTALVSV